MSRLITKIEIGGLPYKANLYESPSNGPLEECCAKCSKRRPGILVRFKMPFKLDVRLCYKCVLRYVIRFKGPQDKLAAITTQNRE